MAEDLEPYCQAHPYFFAPVEATADDTLPFDVHTAKPWSVTREFEWTYVVNSQLRMEPQGWKIHVSATLANADEILELCSAAFLDLGVPFKFLSTRGRLYWRNSKVYPREHAGKFITCYPTETVLESLLQRLSLELAGFDGPYILSDRRWGEAPIFLRYGVFRPRQIKGQAGPIATLLETPDSEFVLDDREPYFHIPFWAKVPQFMHDWSTADPSSDSEMPFDVTDAVQFSNAGGTYRGRVVGQNNAKAIIKEARPFAGLDYERRTSTERLAHEAHVLNQLRGIPNVASVLWSGSIWEHQFLVVSEHDAIPLNRWVTRNYPLYDRSPENVESYFRRASLILKHIQEAVGRVHERGWAHLDLHPSNVLVTDDENLETFLIDFEAARPIGSDPVLQTLAAPGFRTKQAATADVIDWYGVHQLGSYLQVPVIMQSELVPGYPAQARTLAERTIPKVIGTGALHELQMLRATIDELAVLSAPVHGVAREHGTASRAFLPNRYENPGGGFETFGQEVLVGLTEMRRAWPYSLREFPVHPYGLDDFSTGLAYGDSGIIASMLVSGGINGPYAASSDKTRAVEKLLDEALNAPVQGLFAGAVGSLFALTEFGEHELVLRAIDERLSELLNDSGTRIFDQGPGVMLGLIRLLSSTENSRTDADTHQVLEQVRGISERYALDPTAFAPLNSEREIAGNRHQEQNSGLFYGHLGLAWLYAETLRATGDADWVDHVNLALRHELTGYEFDSKHGTLQLVQGYRELPYLSMGSAGFGVVLALLDRDQVDEDICDKVDALRVATEASFSVYPGLFNGYAGLALGNLGLRQFLRLPTLPESDVTSVLAGYAISVGKGIAFAGDSGLRLTSDLATGSAGIVLALNRIRVGRCDPLPVSKPSTQTGTRLSASRLEGEEVTTI